MRSLKRLFLLCLVCLFCLPALSLAADTVCAGDHVIFGAYEQDGNAQNGAEPLEWLVLDVQGDDALLLSRYGLECMPYHEEWGDITWEKCTLRSWLNDTFYKNAFSLSERNLIKKVQRNAGTNPSPLSKTEPGNATKDSVFLLNVEEAGRYLCTELLECRPVKRIEDPSYLVDGCTFWWLSTPALTQDTVVMAGPYGVDLYGREAIMDDSVRPAIWVKASAIQASGTIPAAIVYDEKKDAGSAAGYYVFEEIYQDGRPMETNDSMEFSVDLLENGKLVITVGNSYVDDGYWTQTGDTIDIYENGKKILTGELEDGRLRLREAGTKKNTGNELILSCWDLGDECER